MCGIAGKMFADRQHRVDPELLAKMCRAMIHRGPDDEGLHMAGHVGLGMRRLRVIDLPGGHQPMANENEYIWTVFNGEIYNYRELRDDLESRGHRFRTASDTEVIVHLYEEKGRACLDDLRGMFAFALYDSRSDELLLARDRVGKKPLYYAELDGSLVFSSELQSLLSDRQVDRTVDLRAIDQYLTALFVPHPRTIYRSVKQLPPGSYAIFSRGRLQIDRYWTVRYDDIDRDRSFDETVDELDKRLRESVRLRLLADVPLGAFLSGGLDSSLVVALMQKVGGRQVRTFSIGFEDASFNELGYARQVARELGTEHEDYTVTYGMKDLLPKLLDHFGEPFADSSALPTYHLSEFTRKSVTVALSGDGGDEIFGGYRRYRARLMADSYNRWPAMLGRGAFEWAVKMPAGAVHLLRKQRPEAPQAVRRVCLRGQRGTRDQLGFFFARQAKYSLYAEKFADILDSADILNKEAVPDRYFIDQRHAGRQAMLWVDLMTYLPDDINSVGPRSHDLCFRGLSGQLHTGAPR